MTGKTTLLADEKAVRAILESKCVYTFFQPVVCLSTKRIVGFEAFSRGGAAGAGAVGPAVLFHDALSPELKLGMDQLCREKSLSQYKSIHDSHREKLFFLNVNPDILEQGERSEMIRAQVAGLNIDPASVVIELPLSRVIVGFIEEFVRLYREFGFKVCLDNCGVDDPFCLAISRIKPDFIKINRSFFAKASLKDYSARLLEDMQEVADRYGAMVIGQGVEVEDDSIRLLSAGVHLQQGYFFTKDEQAPNEDPAKLFMRKIMVTHDKYKSARREMVRRRKDRFDATFKVVGAVCAKLSNLSATRFDDACKTLVRNLDLVVAMFVVDETGEQITAQAHVRPVTCHARAMGMSGGVGFGKGVDHSMRDSVMYLELGYEKFVTRPYISPFTGEQVCLISRPFYNNEGVRYIACIELAYPGSP
jgi:EAL domain-containing protein (putative c-di-GMP-specific phosphodiesterase class I)